MCNVWIELAGLIIFAVPLTVLTIGAKSATREQRNNRLGAGLALLIAFCLLGHHLLLSHAFYR